METPSPFACPQCATVHLMVCMIYGANGYTGQLIAEVARKRGEAPSYGRQAGDDPGGAPDALRGAAARTCSGATSPQVAHRRTAGARCGRAGPGRRPVLGSRQRWLAIGGDDDVTSR